MKTQQFLAALVAIGFAGVLDANALTFTFQPPEVSAVGNQGSSTVTFHESGFALTAMGFGPSGGVDLWVKNGGADETGLGLANDGDHEIKPGSFIQLTVPTTPASTLDLVVTGSLQRGETADIRFSTVSGTLGSTVIGTHTGDGTWSFSIPSADQNGFIDITADSGNVLLDSVSVTVPSIPDGGLTVALLGGALMVLTLARRKLMA